MRILLIAFLWTSSVVANSYLDLELGLVENSFNRVRIPGDEGTEINLAPSFEDLSYYHRIEFVQSLVGPHGVRLLYAPLKVSGPRSFPRELNFNGGIFSPNTKTDTSFKFNSYRATYFYQILNTTEQKLMVGGTAKIRDAEITLEQSGIKKSRKDLGIVPLLFLSYEKFWDNGAGLRFSFDGLVAPQGRAIDTALQGVYTFTDRFSAGAGYRILEGGADNEKVYTFSQFNFYFLSLRYEL